MRIAKKREVLHKLKQLQIRQGIFAEYVEKGKETYSYEFLADWQTEAIELGNILEEEGRMSIVSRLETYCEQIYECSLMLNKKEKLLEEYRNLNEILREIESDIGELPAKMKIAFFPYKISMWDSLESIWEAASKDGNCECQVVPIPYYSKNNAGEIEQEYFEGQAFATRVPIMDYRTYFIEQEKPDVMYIHNPYDQYNKTTMVHPRFFSTELKKGGGVLVYVPYYVAGHCTKYEDMLAVCGNIGAIYSDYIIMQCANLKKAYACCGFPDKRLLILGSPKIDAIYKIKYKEYDVLKKWHSVIENRKVILLNTSISTSIQKQQWLECIRELIVPILQDERLALIWRPHPLLLNAVRALTKEEKQYDKLFETITGAPNAIIDDSETAEAAIKVSDAMISDYSSLVMQYSFTGKPVYLLTGKSTERKQHIFCDYFSNYFREDGISVEEFLEMVMQGTDRRREERILYAKNSMENTDGFCGEKIHQEIYTKAIERMDKWKR